MFSSNDWHLYCGSGLYEWKVENGILNMSLTLNSTQDEYFMLQREFPLDKIGYPISLKVRFKTQGQAVHFGIEAYDSNNNCLGRVISWKQITDWRTMECHLPSKTACIRVFIDDVSNSASIGNVNVLIDWIEVASYHWSRYDEET